MIHISAARGQVAQVLTGVLDFLFRPLRSMLSSPPASLFPARHPPRGLPDILTWPDPADLRCRKSFPNARATTPARADPESLRVRRSSAVQKHPLHALHPVPSSRRLPAQTA